MEPVTDSQAEAESEEQKNGNDDENLLTKAQELMLKITSSSSRPSPKVLHALASMLETQESRYIEELGHFSPNIGRSSHNIGRLGNLIRDNDEFFELISSEFLSETRYSTSVRSAAARLLLCCSTTWMYPYVLEDTVLENLKNWVMDDNVRSADGCNGKHDLGRNEPTDSEMLRTYATGLLAVCLTGGGQLVEDVLTSGLPAKLMRYLRTRVLGETNTSQKDASFQTEGKNVSGATCMRGREENRGRFRQVLDVTHLGGLGIGDEDNHCLERDQDKSICNRQIRGEECQVDVGELLKSREVADDLVERVGMCDVDEDDVEEIGEDRWHRELHEGMAKFGDGYGTSRFLRDADADENERDDLSRHKVHRGWVKTRGKGKVNEVAVETERALVSPGSGLRLGAQGRSMRERNLEMKRLPDAKKYSNRTDDDPFLTERDNNDDCFQECKVGTRDISDLVKRAIKAAEAEARAANAPAEAIRAAGDAAADLVKTVALEALKLTNDEEAAVLAASEAASTVVDAANATEVSRSSSNVNEDTTTSKAIESETDDEIEGFFLLDYSSLAQLREKYCIQCLEVLGEYVEVLGPVLHEKGVDVCLSLLQQNSKQKEVSKVMILLSDVLKLICALAAHRKFAAVFVDRGGMQKLLAVPRVAHTFFGLSSCLFTICSLPGIMERACALPLDVVRQVVELALELLECPQDLARKNAAVFFATAFLFRVVVDSFDAQEGLKKSLSLLQGAASVRSGGNSGISNLGSLRNDGSPAEVLTLSEKQVAFHTCIALRQYFRAHLLLLVESLRPNKKASSVGRNVQNARAAYKPLDLSNEAIDAVLIHIQRDRKLGTAFVRARWPVVDKFLGSNGHITMLELCQAPPVERYLHDLAQYALGVLQIVTLVPYSRKLIVNATLSNDRLGMAVILDAANGAGYVDAEVIQPALNVLVNLVCPPPSISNKPSAITQGQQSVSVQTSNGPGVETRERLPERNISDRAVSLSIQNESRERNGESCADSSVVFGASSATSSSQTAVPTITSGVVGDRRISLGPGAGCAGLAAQLEQGYHQAREAVRANNGIKVLLHLLHPRIPTPPPALDCVRALACRVLLGLARDDTIAHILTKLQVGKKLSELIRDSGGQTHGIEQGRWQSELAQVAIELIAIVTNSGRASTLAATDAAAPTLRRIERAAIAAATPITYHSKELLLLIHEHLLASGLATTAASLLKESRLSPLPSLAAPPPLLHQTSVQETLLMQFHWPSGRAPRGFLSDSSNPASRDDYYGSKSDLAVSSKKKSLAFSPSLSFQLRNQSASHPSTVNKISGASGNPSISAGVSGTPVVSELKSNSDLDSQLKTPIVFPLKRKITELKDPGFPSPKKRFTTGEHMFRSPVCQTPRTVCKSSLPVDSVGRANPSGGILSDNLDDSLYNSTPAGQMIPSTFQFGIQAEPQHSNPERVTLDSLVVQYLKHQHRQCPAPITTLPPLPLLQPHTCPEAKRSLDLPANVTSRMGTREFRNQYGGIHGNRRDRQFVYSRFKPWRTCRDDAALLTCIAFLGDASRIVTGSHNGELKIFDTNSCNVLESHTGHQSPVTLVQSAVSGGTQLLLTSGSYDVQLWDASSVSSGPLHSFEGKGGRLSNSCTTFAALSRESSRREVLLYDIQTYNLELKLSDTPTSPLVNNRGHVQSLIHFSPSDTMLLWNGVLWDRRGSGPVHRFDQFTDYGGGGFHPAGNEVIINSEVWDLRKFKLLRTVPSLDQTVIKFNASGDVIYAILRRNLEDITSAVNTRRVRHPLFSAFRTVDAVNYYDIATIPATVPVDRCVLDFATEPTDSFVGLVSMDDHEEMFASARLYEIGRRRPTDDDSDPDDAQSEEDDEDDDDSEADEDQIFGTDLDGDMDSDADEMSNDDEDGDDSGDEFDDDDGDEDFGMDGVDFDGAPGMLEIATGGDGDGDDDSQVVESESSGDESDFVVNGFGF